jgi:hypothetical protein
MRFKTCAAFLSLAVIGAIGVVTTITVPAHAEDWCGFHDKTGSRVRCGYTSLDECKQNVTGKNAVCMPNPDFAMRSHNAATGAG